MRIDNLPLDPSEILKAMEYSNKIMSINQIKLWLEKYDPSLFWKEDFYFLHPDKENGIGKPRIPQLYPHEFLYIITNAKDRLEYVKTI